MIEKGVNVDARADSDQTPLHIAAEENSADVARLLIQKGADLEAKTKDGKTPLQHALYLNVAQMLISKGADKSGIDLKELLPEDVEEQPW